MTATNREASSQPFKFRHLPPPYAIVRLPPDIPVPDWAAKGDFTSITRTADELSVVCPAENIPKEIDAGLRWICLKLEGPFPFSQTGVLLSFIEPLANQGIPIFAISTFETDYILVQEEFTDLALNAVQAAGHELLLQGTLTKGHGIESALRTVDCAVRPSNFPERCRGDCTWRVSVL